MKYSIQIWPLLGPILTLWSLLNFQILEKWWKIKFFISKISMVLSSSLFIVVWSRYIALKLLWRIWENDVRMVSPFHTFLQTFYKNISILVLSCNLSHFVEGICLISDILSKMTSQWKKNWYNFWSRRDFDLCIVLEVILLKAIQLEKYNYIFFLECIAVPL